MNEFQSKMKHNNKFKTHTQWLVMKSIQVRKHDSERDTSRITAVIVIIP